MASEGRFRIPLRYLRQLVAEATEPPQPQSWTFVGSGGNVLQADRKQSEDQYDRYDFVDFEYNPGD